MPKKKKKESLKEKRRRAALKRQRALKAERIRREREREKKRGGWSRGKVLAIVFLLFLVPLAYGVWQYTSPSSNGNGDTPPSSNGNGELPSLYTLTDKDFTEFRGRVVVLDMFATWCQPCIQEIPHLAQINEKYNSSDVVILSIASPGDDVTTVRQFKKNYDMTWIVAMDTVGVFDKYNVMYIPTLVILDQNGDVHYENEGLTTAETLSSKIDSLLSQ